MPNRKTGITAESHMTQMPGFKMIFRILLREMPNQGNGINTTEVIPVHKSNVKQSKVTYFCLSVSFCRRGTSGCQDEALGSQIHNVTHGPTHRAPWNPTGRTGVSVSGSSQYLFNSRLIRMILISLFLLYLFVSCFMLL